MSRRAMISPQVKSLEMMGYEVTPSPILGAIYVTLHTDAGFRVQVTVNEEEIIYGNYIVESIVNRMNDLIIKEF